MWKLSVGLWPANSAKVLGGAFLLEFECFAQFSPEFLLVRLLPVGGLEDALDVVLFEAVDVVGLDHTLLLGRLPSRAGPGLQKCLDDLRVATSAR